jgi:catechol 2,3-dioxygenase-like lactoylglutathione lyase family enzyme
MIKKLDSLLLFVVDPHATAEFYKKLGFEISRESDKMVVATIGDFEIHAHNEKEVDIRNETELKPRGAGVYIYVSVEDIDAFHASLLDKGLIPSSAPRDWPWGNREFVIKDPDGYKLVLYEPIAS